MQAKVLQYILHTALFLHGQITQIAIHQVSDPENKKVSPWKVFGTNHHKTLQLLSRRGPKSQKVRLYQYYIGPKMTFRHFSNFCRKRFPGLKKEISCTYGLNVQFLFSGSLSRWKVFARETNLMKKHSVILNEWKKYVILEKIKASKLRQNNFRIMHLTKQT